MKKTGFLLALVLSGAMLFAQDAATPSSATPPPRAHSAANFVQHRVNFLTTMLSLTPAQQQQATTILTNAAGNKKEARGGMRTAHQNLQTAIKSNDAAGIDAAATSIGNLMAQNISAEAKTKAALYQILTPDQQAKMDQLEHMRGGARFHGGFGAGK